MSPFSSITMDQIMCFYLKIGRWNSDLPVRLSEFTTSPAGKRTVYDMALLSTEW